MAEVKKTGIKCNDELSPGTLLMITSKKGKLLITPREADEILADLQILYHESNLNASKKAK